MQSFKYEFAIAIAMATTIQVGETTKQLLDRLKGRESVETYDQLIQCLLRNHEKVSDMFGFTRKKPLKFRKEDEMKFNEV